ncbi:MAG: hypothetical protein KBT03_10745 [Bacteroidales bacterium]|nr:hypothetical protein [Candidatus Scybalousia scybalohippi]
MKKNLIYKCESWKEGEVFKPGKVITPMNVYGENFWNKFIDEVKDKVEKPEVAQKGEKGGILYVTLKEGAPMLRSQENYKGLHICAFDIDDYQNDVKVLFEKLEESNLNYLIYTTHYHLTQFKEYTKRFRVAIPLSKEEDLKSYRNIKIQIMNLLSLTETDLKDKSNNTVSQVEYLPTLPNEEARQNYRYAYKTSGKHFEYDNTKVYAPSVKTYTKSQNITYTSNSTYTDTYINTYSLASYTFEKEYSIKKAIDTILVPRKIYIPEGYRYKYYSSNSEAGVEIYDNHIASFHSSKDPIGRYGNILHAFDACVFSLYGRSGEDFPVDNLDYYRDKFQDYILKQGIITKEMMQKYQQEYINLKQIKDEE